MSTPERFRFTSSDGLSIACEKWRGHHEARGVVQIAHGLGEHVGRYAELAKVLVEDELVAIAAPVLPQSVTISIPVDDTKCCSN